MKTKKRNGYTLLEILVIVVIVGILVSIGVPQYNRLIRQADVSDALHNIDMLSGAQNKYRMQKGVYTNDLSNLDVPIKSNTAQITTKNFTYSAGNPREDNYCIYSESRTENYTLARNYKTNSKVLCSGSDCSKISSLVSTGSLTELCGSEYNGECDLICNDPKILSNDPCACVCDSSTCLGHGVQDEKNCHCKCLGQSVWNAEQNTCTCPASVELSCDNAGLKFDNMNCDCIPEEPSCQNTCNSIQVQNPSTCACTCAPGMPQNKNEKFCSLGRISQNCNCQCINENLCEGVFNQENCSCTCNKTQQDCAEGYILNTTTCACEEKNTCTNEQISACSGPNKTLKDDCSCMCSEQLLCELGQMFNPITCVCETADTECALNEDMCANEGKSFNAEECRCDCTESTEEFDCPNGHFDTSTCACACDLTDEICALVPGKRQILSPSSCECIESICPSEHAPCYDNNGNGHYNYRTCECECDLTNDYCKEKFGKFLNNVTCECVSTGHM